ncbi:MAG: hypothetical protein HRU26_06980 [Psychroserpens sp.]|nr:hypothetical protein [Psychroserpens sp.]
MEELSLKEKIVAAAKSEGLEIAEDSVKSLIPLILKISEIAVKHTDAVWDDLLHASLKGPLETLLLGLADKIDGEVG